MPKGRLEAFSDGVIAILITIMVLELRTPVGTSWHALGHELPVLLAYALSFVYLGIYWNNHHHMLAAVSRVSGAAMWANLHLLFWLSLIPFSTAWMSEHRFPSVPTAVYGIVLLCAAIAYYILQAMLLRAGGESSVLRAALGSDVKGKISPLLYCLGIGLSFVVCRSLARRRRVRRRGVDVAGARPPRRTPREHCSQEAERIGVARACSAGMRWAAPPPTELDHTDRERAGGSVPESDCCWSEIPGPKTPASWCGAAISPPAGGQAANVAAWASALGASSRLICKRGTDTSSELAAAELRRYGAEICGPVVPGRAGVVVSIRDQRSGRTMASDRGVSSLLDATELDPSWVASCEVLHVSGYCLMAEPIAEAAIYAARHARRVTVDLASAHDIELLGAQTFISRLQALGPDLAFATDAERAAVPGFETSWVTKHGARGATFPEGFHPAPVVAAIDSTGAGDALAAGYLVGGPELAIAAATHSLGLVGAMPSQRRLSAAP